MASRSWKVTRAILCAVIFCFTIGFPGVAGHTQRKGETPPDSGYWSSEAHILPNTWVYPYYAPTSVQINSPDQKNSIISERDSVTIRIGSEMHKWDLGEKADAELAWSPDSQRFFLTWSDGGLVGMWHVQVYDVSTGHLKAITGVEKGPRDDFDRLVRQLPRPASTVKYPESVFWESARYCYSNVVGAQWLNGSSELLISAVVDPEGDCKHAGEFRMYRVAIPSGVVLQRYDQTEARRLFSAGNIPKFVP